MIRSMRKLGAIAAVATIAACGDGSTGPGGGPDDEAGTLIGSWHVVTLNAHELPAESSPGLTMSAGLLEFAEDGSYYMEMVYNGVARSESGTYSANLDAGILTLDPEADDPYTGHVDLNGDTMTAAIGGVTLGLEREGTAVT